MEKVMRGKLRAQLTNLIKSALEYIKEINWRDLEENADEKEKAKVELNCYYKRIENLNILIKKANDALQSSIAAEDLNKECDSIIDYEDRTVTAIAQLDNALQRVANIYEANSVVMINNGIAQQVTTPTSGSNIEEIKLKRIELRKFNGNFEDWLPFWEQFKVAVHENNNLSAAAKFNHLNTALEGKAAATIEGYLPTAECYNEVIKVLENEYGSNDKLIEKYIQKLVNIKPISTTSDAKGLRNLYNEISSTMRTLTALKVQASQYGLMIKSILLRAIPAKLRISFHRTTQTNNENTENIKNLLEFLKNEIEAIEKSQLSERDKEENKKSTKNATAAALFTNSLSQNKYCVFCKNNTHSTKECKSKTSVSEKKNLLKREGRCYRCANKSHTSKFCKAQWIKCEECNGRHITSLCEKNTQKSKETDEEKRNEKKPTYTEKLTVQTNLTTALNTIQSETTEIFLQTAKAIIMNKKENKKFLSRIIMDNGSQRSFITEKLKNKLELKRCGNQEIKIMSFGENVKNNSSLYETVILKIKSQYNNEVSVINVVVVPNICADILPSIENLNLDSNINFADITSCNESIFPGINLLIGQDYYWQFNSENCKVLSNNLMAVNTYFGWTVQGCKNQNKQLTCVLNTNEQIEEQFDVSKFWDLESIGISGNNRKISETTKVYVNWKNDRYEIRLPWKNIENNLNDNKTVALKRLRTQTIKLLYTN